MKSELIFTNDVATAIDEVVERLAPDKVFVLCDKNTELDVFYRHLRYVKAFHDVAPMIVWAGEDAKTLSVATALWEMLSKDGATRRSLLINIGGGAVTDLGGFVASTFKRGISFVNVPTTLLGAVDAAVGGKTGINLSGLKNEIGVFNEPEAVIVSSMFFSTLPREELMSGMGEVLKHALLSSTDDVARVLNFDLDQLSSSAMLPLLRRNVEIKDSIVSRDPHEQGLRKALNLGHTAGHAFESVAMERKQRYPHGYAVAHGLVTALVLSRLREGFPSTLLHQVAAFVKENYGSPIFRCGDYDRLLELMRHDKKNTSADFFNFTLLSAPGEIKIDCHVTADDVKAALDITCDLL